MPTLCALLLVSITHAAAPEPLRHASSPEGYLARLLINETPFPGERGWVSVADTKAAMVQIVWVLHGRRAEVPEGYLQEEVATLRSDDIIDIITAGGERGQCDGFYLDRAGRPAASARVHERIGYLTEIAGRGRPGRFAELLAFAQGLADSYIDAGITEADRFAALSDVGGVRVTGRAYSWMTDADMYDPGGDYVRIPDAHEGSLGGNRFFTLRRR